MNLLPLNPQDPKFNIRQAHFPADANLVRQLFRDYQTDIQVDLCFQSFEQELATLPGKYQCVLLADGGCVALRPYGPGVIELKRLFVYPSARGQGLGLSLIHAAIAEARALGYSRLHLDTFKSKMPSAVRMYKALGFVELPAEEGIAVPDLVDMELDLELFGAQQNRANQTNGA